MNTEYIEVSSNESITQKNNGVNNGLREGESIKALIASKYGEKATEYFSRLMSDINEPFGDVAILGSHLGTKPFGDVHFLAHFC